MSTIVTSNISDGTTTVGTEYVVNGSAKVHVGFNAATNTVYPPSLNVSSLTDNGVGNHNVNFTNNMAAGGYTIVLGSSGPVNGLHTHAYVEAVLTSSYSHRQFRDDNSSLRADGQHYGTVHGDLA